MIDSDPSQFEESRALRLFPTFVWRADLRREIHQAINQAIVAQLGQMRRCLPRLQPGQA